jgi:hypothetical protein
VPNFNFFDFKQKQKVPFLIHSFDSLTKNGLHCMLHVSFPSVARAHVFWVQVQGQMLSEVLQGRGYSQVSDVPSGEEDAKGGPQVAEAEAEAGLEQGVPRMWQVRGDAFVA